MKNNNFRTWLKLVTGVTIFPFIIIIASNFHLSLLKEEKATDSFASSAAKTLEELRLASATDNYISKNLKELFSSASDARDITSKTNSFLSSHEIEAEFLVWNKDKVYYSNFDHEARPGDWPAAFLQMNKIKRGLYEEEEKIPPEMYKNLRSLFGPHFFPRYYFVTQQAIWLTLLRTDSSMSRPLVWLNINKKFGLAVFLDHKILDSSPGALTMINEWKNTENALAMIKENNIYASNENLEKLLAENLEILKKPLSQVQEIDNYRIKTGIIDSQTIGIIAGASLDDSAYFFNKTLLTLNIIFAFITFVFLRLSYLKIVSGASTYISVRKQILLLFLISTLLPGLALYVLAFDYLQHYESGLLNQSFNQSLTYLQDIDELYKSEFPLVKRNLETSINKLKASLKAGKPDAANILPFARSQEKLSEMFFLIASTSPIISSHLGIVKDTVVIEDLGRNDLKTSNFKMNIVQGVDLLGKYYLARVSGRDFPVKKGIKAEHLSNAFFQKDPSELFKMFMESGTFWEWGLGDRRHPSYFYTFELFAADKPDYLFAMLFNEQNLEQAYLQRMFHNLNRNSLSLRIKAISVYDSSLIPPDQKTDNQVLEFGQNLSRGILTRPERVKIAGKEVVLVGHKCKFLKNYNLVGLLPTSNVTEKVTEQRNLFILLGAVSILISLSLGLSIAHTFLHPTQKLQFGVQALKERNFSYRLPELGSDEFGDLSLIFNNALIDLEEMSVAAKVQQKLISATNEAINHAGLQLFVQSFSSQPFGGYFTEFCDLGEKGKVMILGDVKEGGIASCLLLAFVKATFLQFAELYTRPEELLARLNSLMIKCSREGYRKSMGITFVHLGDSKEISIIAAGMPGPLIINHKTGKIRTLKVATNNLGASPKIKTDRHSLTLETGESMIALNNGFYAQHKADVTSINNLILKSFANKAEVFFENICRNHAEQNPDSTEKQPLSAIIIQGL